MCGHTSGWHTLHNLVLILAERKLLVQRNQWRLKYPEAFNFEVIAAVTMTNTVPGRYAAYSGRCIGYVFMYVCVSLYCTVYVLLYCVVLLYSVALAFLSVFG
jgi:hypothetical protein